MKKLFPVIGACLWLLSCASDSFYSDNLAATADDKVSNSSDHKIPCTAGQQRCNYSMFEKCVDGFFAPAQDCSQVCSTALGCVACDPQRGNTCVDNNVHACQDDGTIGAELEKCYTEPCREGKCGMTLCSAESQLIYVVDRDNRLLSFSPANGANEFKLIKTLSCPASASLQDSAAATPFSMSVDRSAKAWILYSSGEIFGVDTTTGQCEKTNFAPKQQGFELFGMGFVSDEPGSNNEKLFISGGAGELTQPSSLGYIDTQTLKITKLGTIPSAENSPELTGTGQATLFGYFPGTANTFVAELDKKTGAIKQKWKLPAQSGTTVAWAFAHWGGKFFIFVSTQADMFGPEQSVVIRLDPATGQADTIIKNSPYAIVGAGVSTCAPTIE